MKGIKKVEKIITTVKKTIIIALGQVVLLSILIPTTIKYTKINKAKIER